jgi:putative transcriptional regulator
LFEGGPVQKESAVALVRLGPDVPRLARDVNPITSRFGTVDLASERPDGRGPEIRVFAGYAGWSSGQLETQLAEGALDVVGPATDEMFTADPSVLYRPDPPSSHPAVARKTSAATAVPPRSIWPVSWTNS